MGLDEASIAENQVEKGIQRHSRGVEFKGQTTYVEKYKTLKRETEKIQIKENIHSAYGWEELTLLKCLHCLK